MADKDIIKKERNPKTGNIKVTYSDGTFEIQKGSPAPIPSIKKPTAAAPKGIASKYQPMEDMVIKDVTLPVTGGSDMSQFNKTTTDVIPQKDSYRSTNTVADVSLPQSKKYGDFDLGDTVGTGLSALQAGYGLSQLLKDKRPIRTLDPAYNQLTNEAIAASRYGYTPEQKSLLQQQIVEGKNAQVARINALAGGNAAVGLANARAAINDMYSKNLQLRSEDERLKMQKAQYAGAMAGNRAQMSNQILDDKMNAFMQKQQAGAELLGAGIQNFVGSLRAPQERAHQERMNKLIYGV